MRRYVCGLIAGGAFLFQGGFAAAQNSLQTLQQELNAAKQQHKEVTTKMLTNFFSQIDAAMASPDAAIALYAQANTPPSDNNPPELEPGSEAALLDSLRRCGIPATPVQKENENETQSEKEARLAADQIDLSRMGIAVQLHCGIMHYAALFVVKPDQKGLQNEWVAWLKSTAQIYPQLALPPINNDQNPDPQKNKRERDNNQPKLKREPSFYPEDMKGKAMRDSVISKFLGFNAWDENNQGGNTAQASPASASKSDPGGWSVRDLPKLYRTNVLDPLRTSPTAATLAAWDAYIAMANADERDTDKWNQVVYPPLQFDRACDDYAIAPNTEKLEELVNLIKANPTCPSADDWISRVGKLLDDYRVRHGGKPLNAQSPTTAPTAPTGNPNVTVTTEQQGDATIITTHTNTNSAPVAPVPPTPPAPPVPTAP